MGAFSIVFMMSSQKSLLHYLKRHTFISNVATLASGTIIAQLLPLLASPALTRLYSPEQFGLFALFMAFVTSLSQAVTGHLEVAMITPKSSRIAKELFVIALYFALGFVILSLFFITFFNVQILGLLNAIELSNWIYMIPLMLLAMGLSNLTIHYANRNKHYLYMTHAALLQGTTIVGVSLLLGFLEIGFSGLIIGYASGAFASLSYLWWRHRSTFIKLDFSLNKRKYIIAKKYKDYPLFSGNISILDGLSLALPTFFLAASYPEAVVGYYALVMRVLYSPLTFLSTSVGHVNLKKVVDLIHHKSAILPYLHRITLLLMVIPILPVFLLLFFGPELFAFFFGADWKIAGEYAQILAPVLIIRFTASTLSGTLGATQHPQLAGLWKLISFTLTLGVFLTFSGTISAQQLLTYLVISDSGLYLFYYILIYYAAIYPKGQS